MNRVPTSVRNALCVAVAVLWGTACNSNLDNAPNADAGANADMAAERDGAPADATLPGMDGSGPGPDAGVDAGFLDLSIEPDAGSPTDGDFYVSTTGNDSNPGTLDQPFRTLARLNDALLALGPSAAGKVAYIRGGTYLSEAGDAASVHFVLHDLHGTAGNPIRVWAYPGERPIFSCENITPTYENPFIFYLDSSSYVHLKGLSFTMLRQVASGTGISRGVNIAGCDHATIELLDVSNVSGTGFFVSESSSGTPSTYNHILNVDSHNNGDGLGDPAHPEYGTWNTGDGFGNTGGDTSSNNVYEGCRAWLNSDDGYDWFDWAGTRVELRGCWSFWNGIKPWGPINTQPNASEMTPTDPSVFFGDADYVVSFEAGEGFKLGGFGGAGPEGMPTVLKKYLSNCVSFENMGTGYSENMAAEHSHAMQFLNCVAYSNGNDGFGFGVGRSVGIAHVFRNNWAFHNNQIASGADWVYDGEPDNISNNYWASVYNDVNYGNLLGAVTVTNADFASVSSLGAAGPRQADGSLPELDFLHLAADSDLIDRGVDVGLPYNGASPDVGAYER